MKHLLLLINLNLIIFLTGCGGNSSELQSKVDSLNKVIESQQATIKATQDSLAMIKFPADQRLAKIKELIAEENYLEAKNAITQLQSLFPNSSEAAQCKSLSEDIESKLAAVEAEKERIKAMGFKALEAQSKTTIEYNTIAISGISVSSKYTHDAYPTYTGSEWLENVADRGNKYITATMDVTSTSKNPAIPTLAVYTINGDKLTLDGVFGINFASWSDYGSYLGNYAELKNDFSKVGTVKFKLGCELPERVFSKPYMVVLKKANTQVRYEDRFNNPPISYSGDAGYPQTLSIDNFNNGSFVAVKIANL